jgi:aminomethyltransferase
VLSIDQLVRDYGDPYDVARICRRECALFDFSFVHRARVSGRNALREVESFQPREVRNMAIGQIRYSVKTDQQKRVRSDLTLWRVATDSFEIMSGFRDDILELLSLAAPVYDPDKRIPRLPWKPGAR